MNVIGMDIGGTSLRIGTLDEKMSLTMFQKVPQKLVLQGDSVAGIVRFIAEYVRNLPPETKIAALAIGIPGTLDKDCTTVLSAPNVHGLSNVPLKSALEAHFPFPILLAKDVSMLFFHDLRRFSLAHTGVMMACYVGTGIGNVISIGGSLFFGDSGAAGELGHIPAWDHHEACGCGNDGCVETAVGGKQLALLQKTLFPETDINFLFTQHANHPALQNYVRHLAIPIATEINIIDPSIVILGGGVLSMKDFPRDMLIAAIRTHARKPLPEKNLRFLFSKDNGTNGVFGAGAFAWATMGGNENG